MRCSDTVLSRRRLSRTKGAPPNHFCEIIDDADVVVPVVVEIACSKVGHGGPQFGAVAVLK